MKNIIYISFLIIINSNLSAQNFINGDLDGIIGSSSLPNGWTNIQYTDINCIASSAPQATPDLVGLTGPFPQGGLWGNPYSGNTFVSGLHSGLSIGDYWHEGIRQTVSGFITGCPYSINFFQAVVKQSNFLDSSGGWTVILNNSILGSSAPTISLEPYNSLSFPWEFRSFTFYATSTSHIIKFLPTDDDNDIIEPNGIRMGIDSIYIINLTQPGMSNILGIDKELCEGETYLLNATTTNATYLWQDGNTHATYTVTEAGTYWVQITNNCGITSDTIKISYNPLPVFNLGTDTLICEKESLLLDVTTQNALYLWQDNSTNSTYTVTQPGNYWVQVTENNCSAYDTIMVDYIPIPFINFINSDTICLGDLLILDASTPYASYLWNDNSINAILTVTETGSYWVEVTNNCGSTVDTIEVSTIDCTVILDMPNIFTPNNDGKNDFFKPIKINAIKNATLSIYNRWGQKIYETDDINTGWSGEQHDTGIYYWIANCMDREDNYFTLKGFLTLSK